MAESEEQMKKTDKATHDSEQVVTDKAGSTNSAVADSIASDDGSPESTQNTTKTAAEQAEKMGKVAPAATTRQEKNSEVPTDQKPSRRKRGGVIVALLLALIAVGSSAYLGYRLEVEIVPQIEKERTRVDDLASRVQAMRENEKQWAAELNFEAQELRSQFEHQAGQLSEMDDRLTAINAELGRELDAIIESTASLYQDFDARPQDWELDDVSLLLRVGAKQLQLTGDPKAILPIWQTAVDQVGRISDPKILVVRAQLQKEIALLENMSVVDLELISTNILHLIDAVDDLSMRTPPQTLLVNTAAVATEEVDVPEMSSVRAMFQTIWMDVKSLIRVTRVADSDSLPVNPNLQNELIQHLKLSLAAAQVAALREQTGVYRANLQFVKSVIADQFDMANESVVDFSNTLDELLALPLIVQLPDLSGAYELLQEMLNRPPAE